MSDSKVHLLLGGQLKRFIVRYESYLLCAIVCIQGMMLAFSTSRHSPTWDEVGHMVAGLSHWKFGNFSLYSVNPPLVRTLATAPIAFFVSPNYSWEDFRKDPKQRSEVAVGRTFIRNNTSHFQEYFVVARLTILPFAFLGTWICWRWARELFGVGAGLFAAGNWAFSPLVLGHGALITSDVAGASIGVAFLYVFSKWIRNPNWSLTILGGVFASLAMLVKSIWIFGALICLTIWIICRILDRRNSVIWQEALKLVVAGGLALFLINAFYGFEGSFTRLGDYKFISEKLSGKIVKAPKIDSGNRFRNTWLGKIPIPLPSAYLAGMDIQKSDFERSAREYSWRSYLFGEWKQGGWWYYYLVGIAVKEPLPWVVLLAVASVSAIVRPNSGLRWSDYTCLLLPVAALLLLLSSQTSMSRNVRYALPALPFLFIWTSQVALLLDHARSIGKWLVSTCMIWFLASVFLYSPHWISYFNETVGGPNYGYRALIGSNIDWGQDFLYLKKWLSKHPEVTDLKLACMTCFDPTLIGIPHTIAEPYLETSSDRIPASMQGPHPGWYAISVDYMSGSAMHIPRSDGSTVYWGGQPYRYFSHFKPVAKAGYSIFIYHLELEDVQRVRALLGLPLL
jgi:hypothetical protein